MVLLHDAVQVPDRSTAAPTAEFAALLQLCDYLGIRRVSVYIDHSWTRVIWRPQGFLEEPLCSSGIPSGRQQKINRGTCRIDSAIQIGPLASHSQVGFVCPPRPVGHPQFPTAAAVQFRGCCTQRQIVTGSTLRFRSAIISSRFRKLSPKRRVPTDAQYNAQTRSLPACNTSEQRTLGAPIAPV